MLNHDYPGQTCSIAESLEVIGERWSLLIVRDVLNGNRRFGEIQGSLGVARNVLSARLQRLVAEGILERRPYQQSPERFEYFLTDKGLDLWPALIALLNWGARYSPTPGGPPTSSAAAASRSWPSWCPELAWSQNSRTFWAGHAPLRWNSKPPWM